MREAGRALVEDLRGELGAAPDLVALCATEGLATAALVEAPTAFRRAEIFGGTACWGVITRAGLHLDDAGTASALAISGPGGSSGLTRGGVPLRSNARRAAQQSRS